METHIRLLSCDDGASLLRFELDNRDWFERMVAPRDPEFYSPAGVAAHIAHCLDGYAGGKWHACVVVGPSGEIVGRANLKDIDVAAGSAEVGYRIGQQHTGAGLATLALRHLTTLARTEWQLQRLHAFVTDTNMASTRVLLKCGFRQGQRQHRLVQLHGAWVDGYAFECTLWSA